MYKFIKSNEIITIEEAKSNFITDRVTKGLTQRSIEGYSDIIDSFIDYMGIDIEQPILVINKKVLNDYIISRLKEVKPSSVNVALRGMRAFLYYCMEQDYITPFKITTVKYQEEEQPVYTYEELAILLNKMPKYFPDARAYTAIALMASLGTRVGTLVNIRKSDVDFSVNEIKYTSLKNKKLAIMPLSAQLAVIFKKYMHSFDIDSEWLFPDVTGGQLSTHAFRESVEKYCNKCGVEYKGLHSFRRSFAKLFILNGGNAFSLQKILTHSTITMSSKYVKLYSDDLKNGFNDLSPLDTIIHKV